MYGIKKLLRTKMDGEFAVIPLPDKATEGKLYASYGEHSIPKPIVDLVTFCNSHEIQVDVHRKPVTCGCEEAVSARSAAYGVDIPIYQELKAVVLKTASSVKVALYICGDCELPKEVSPRGKRFGIDCELLSEKTGYSILGMDDDPRLISGRLNPVTLMLDYDDRIEHFFDIPDDVLNRPMYTNGGGNTWGIKIDNTPRMLKEVGAQRLDGVSCPIGSQVRHAPWRKDAVPVGLGMNLFRQQKIQVSKTA
jgi:hypothetical protein